MKGRGGKRSASKGRKKKKPTKAARSKASKSKARKTARSPAKAKKSSRRGRTSAKAKKGARKAPAKAAQQRKSAGRPASRDVFGEGNYTASRDFRDAETGFVRRNKNRIPKMGEEAEAALEGQEGTELESAEDAARAHSHSPGEER